MWTLRSHSRPPRSESASEWNFQSLGYVLTEAVLPQHAEVQQGHCGLGALRTHHRSDLLYFQILFNVAGKVVLH